MKKKAFRIALVCGLGLCLAFALIGPGEETHRQRIEKQFSVVNGEHLNLTKAIKTELANPGEYKNIETTYTDLDSFVFVSQKYSVAGVEHLVKAKVDTLGNVLTMSQVR
jgi:hypothetical protein